MAELVIIGIGLLISIVLALIKVIGSVATITWLWVCVPTIVALVIVIGCVCGFDHLFD